MNYGFRPGFWRVVDALLPWPVKSDKNNKNNDKRDGHWSIYFLLTSSIYSFMNPYFPLKITSFLILFSGHAVWWDSKTLVLEVGSWPIPKPISISHTIPQPWRLAWGWTETQSDPWNTILGGCEELLKPSSFFLRTESGSCWTLSHGDWGWC